VLIEQERRSRAIVSGSRSKSKSDCTSRAAINARNDRPGPRKRERDRISQKDHLRNQSAHHVRTRGRPRGRTESRCCRFTSPDTLFKDKCMLRMIALRCVFRGRRRKAPFLHGRGWRGRVSPSSMRWRTAACGPRKLFPSETYLCYPFLRAASPFSRTSPPPTLNAIHVRAGDNDASIT